MKPINLLFSAILVFCSFVTAAQTQKISVVYKDSVRITEPGRRGVYMLKGYFNDAITAQLRKSLTDADLNLIQQHYNEDQYPECVQALLSFPISDDEGDAKSAANLAAMKIYRIAKFDNVRSGENMGEESILMVPAAENKQLGGNCSFTEDFYIIIPTAAIKIL